jgi:hypothetical protein
MTTQTLALRQCNVRASTRITEMACEIVENKVS